MNIILKTLNEGKKIKDEEVKKLNKYIKNIENHDVTLINGLKGSGKYQLMMQLINIGKNRVYFLFLQKRRKIHQKLYVAWVLPLKG